MQKYKKFLLQYKNLFPVKHKKGCGMLEAECLSMDSDKIMEIFAAPSLVTYTKKMKI